MPKERPTFLCRLEIDPRSPDAIIETLTERVADLEAALVAIRAEHFLPDGRPLSPTRWDCLKHIQAVLPNLK